MRRKQPKAKRRAKAPNRLLAMRKQWLKRAGTEHMYELYHGAWVPLYKLQDKRHREVRDLVRAHHEKKRAVKSA